MWIIMIFWISGCGTVQHNNKPYDERERIQQEIERLRRKQFLKGILLAVTFLGSLLTGYAMLFIYYQNLV